MAATCLFAVISVFSALNVLQVTSHKLITDPYPINEWNSILVSSNPIRVFERKHQNATAKVLKLRQVSRARKRSFDECRENDFKCLYGDTNGNDDKSQDGFFDRFSPSSDAKLDADEDPIIEQEDDKILNSGKSYWDSPQGHRRPYDDKNGWVTLDPVPWSTSKISKWHPNVEIHEPNGPWTYASTTQQPVQQFWVSGSSYRPQKPNVQLGIGSNDIITDNKPSGFPTGNSYHSAGFPLHVQQSFLEHKDPYPKYHQQISASHGNYQTRFPGRPHPSTYPSQGNGEWVLLSTKKGYSQPHKWSGKTDSPTKTTERIFWSRKIRPTEISRYHEEDLGDKKDQRLNVAGGKIQIGETAAEKNLTANERIMVPLQVQFPKTENSDDSGSKKKVRLQVLPSPQSTLSHGGMIEVDQNPQTISEVSQEAKIKKLQTIANVKKNKIRGFKLVPANRVTGKGTSQRSALTLAAVGAGMIPATMAVLLPMAIGRSKRSAAGFHSKPTENVHWRNGEPEIGLLHHRYLKP